MGITTNILFLARNFIDNVWPFGVFQTPKIVSFAIRGKKVLLIVRLADRVDGTGVYFGEDFSNLMLMLLLGRIKGRFIRL